MWGPPRGRCRRRGADAHMTRSGYPNRSARRPDLAACVCPARCRRVSAASSAPLPRAREALDRLEQLLGLHLRLALVAGGKRAGDAMADMLVEDLERQRLEGGIHRRALGQDVDALAVILEH